MTQADMVQGDFVRYAPNRMSVNHVNGLRDIYIGKNFVKPPNYRLLRHQAANMFTMINKKEHARRRRIVGPIISDAAMRRLERTMLLHIIKCFSLLGDTCDNNSGSSVTFLADSSKGWSKSRNMSNWCDYLSFDMMGELIFGVRYNLLGSTTHRYVFDAIAESNQRMSVLIHLPIIRSIRRLDRFLFPRAIKARNRFLGFVSRLLEDCMETKSETTSRTLFSILSTSTDPITGEGFSMKEIVAETTNLCVASVDTSSTAMAATFFYLCANQNAYNRVSKEVRSTFSTVDEIRVDAELKSCIYLRACINESLRLSPPAGSTPFRQVTEGGATVHGEYFPSGVEIGVPTYSIQHNERYFPDPFQFKPERWIVSESSEASVRKAQNAFCPFSVGSRSCIGKSVAMAELMITMAVAIFMLDFKFDKSDASGCVSQPREFFVRDHITAITDGPMINFRPR
jgi:cytochrome P450